MKIYEISLHMTICLVTSPPFVLGTAVALWASQGERSPNVRRTFADVFLAPGSLLPCALLYGCGRFAGAAENGCRTIY